MQPNELSNDLMKNIYEALKECCSLELTDLEECDILYKNWVLNNRKYTRTIECTCRYYQNCKCIGLTLKTDDWFMQILLSLNTLNEVIQIKAQTEVEDNLRYIISTTINQIDNCFFEQMNNEKVVKKSIMSDITSIYNNPLVNKFEYENECYMKIGITLLNLNLFFCRYSNFIGFDTLEGSSPLTPFLSEDTINEHEMLINRGYKKLLEDITRNYKNSNEIKEENIDYRNDKYILSWFSNQITEDGLNNIFNEIEQYVEITAQRELVKNILKSIRQDLRKIFYTIENIFYIEDLADKDTERSFLIGAYRQDRKIIYQGIDVEYIFIKYRSIIDYAVELIKAIFPETEGTKLEGKFAFFSDIMKDNKNFDKHILSSNWFQSIKNIRDNVIHHGASCLIYNGDDLGFQMYDLDLNNLVFETEEYMKINENVFRLDRYLLINIAYLYYFLDICFKVMTKKIYKQSNDQIKNALIKQQDIILQLSEHYQAKEFSCTISDMMRKWCNDLLNDF